MQTSLKRYSVGDVTEGFVYNELEGRGLYGLGGSLVIQPEYQRHSPTSPVSQPWRCTVTTCARTRYAVLTIGEAAAYLGLTKSTVDSYRHRGRFPVPDGWRGRRPVWRPETLDAPGMGNRTPRKPG